MITGVNSTMEYKAADGDTWIAITGDSVTGLKSGTYLVRVKGNGTVLASEAVEVTVLKFVPETPTPETGDNSNILLWTALLFVSGGVLSAVTYRKKKQLS